MLHSTIPGHKLIAFLDKKEEKPELSLIAEEGGSYGEASVLKRWIVFGEEPIFELSKF